MDEVRRSPQCPYGVTGGTPRVSHQVWVPLAVLVGIQPLPQAGGDDGARARTPPASSTGGLQPLELP